MDRIESMRVFVRVAHLSSFAATARELRMSAAKVTKHVSSLENHLGVRLLERTTRQVQLTEAGRFYLERCGEALQALDDTDAAMSELARAPSGILRVTAPVDLADDIARVISRYQGDHPGVVVDLRLANHNIDLIDQGFDIGIGLLSSSHGSYVARRLCSSSVACYASPAYVQKHGAPRKPSDLSRHRHLVFVEPAPRTRWSFRKGNRTVEVELEPSAMSNSGRALLAMAVEGVGIVIGPSFMVVQAVRSGALVPLLVDHQMSSFGLYARYPSRRFLPAKTRCFVEALRDYFGDDPEADVWLSSASASCAANGTGSG